MEFTINLGLVGWVLLIGGAIVIGVVAQLIGEGAFRFEWVATAIGAGIGALVASEFLVDLRAFEPVWDGLAIIPALIGAVIVGAVVAVVARYLARGYTPAATA
jgi:uncharacterized membrane protein YeaQ/YmgE (transglycosylase-associated protein family)